MIFIFSIVLGAGYLSYVKFSATYALTFFGYKISVLTRVTQSSVRVMYERSLRVIFLFDVSLSHQKIDVSKKLQKNKKVPSQSFLICWAGFVAKKGNDVFYCDLYFI